MFVGFFFKNHNEIESLNYKCDQCDKTFNTSKNLKQHKKTHEEVGNFSCEECDKLFLKKQSLRSM